MLKWNWNFEDLDRETRDSLLDALNAVYRAMDRHGIARPEPAPGEHIMEYLERIVNGFRDELRRIENAT